MLLSCPFQTVPGQWCPDHPEQEVWPAAEWQLASQSHTSRCLAEGPPEGRDRQRSRQLDIHQHHLRRLSNPRTTLLTFSRSFADPSKNNGEAHRCTPPDSGKALDL